MSKVKNVWSSRLTFIIAAVGSAVGLGNIWRYPTTVFQNGGGAFFIPYFVAFITAGIPMLILEFVIGSKMRGAAPLAYARISKKWEWLGWIPTMVAGMIIFFYVVILAWAVNFIGFSFNNMSWGSDPVNFFLNDFLGTTGNPLVLGSVNWAVVVALVFIWGGTYLVASKGLKGGLEKFNNILLPIMVVMLIGLMIWSITLPGAQNGLNALFTPDFGALLDPNIWIAAYGQIFFSLSVCMGIMIVYGSYLPKKSEIVNTSFIIGFADVAISMLAAVSVFSILGYMATSQGVAVSDVATAGAGLVFMVFPQGFNLMGGFGQWFGAFFFISLLVAGLTSFISLLEAFSQPFVEKFNVTRKKMFAYTCGFGFFASLLYATGAGMHLLGIVNFVIDYFLTIGGLLQVICCIWIYKKAPEFKAFANEYSIIKLGAWWDIFIKYAFPVIIIFITGTWIHSFATVTAATFTREVLIFVHGGTAAIMIGCSLLFAFIKWRTPIDENLRENKEA